METITNLLFRVILNELQGTAITEEVSGLTAYLSVANAYTSDYHWHHELTETYCAPPNLGVLCTSNYSRQGRYRYGYQGQFAERDEETGWNHFELREYDPIIGRWLVPDPERQYVTPYGALGNDPINGIDPDGKRYIPIQDILKSYGAKTRESYLFPDKGVFVRGFDAILTAIDFALGDWWEVPLKGYDGAVEMAAEYHQQLQDAALPNLKEYKEVLLLIRDEVEVKISEMEIRIDDLRKRNVTKMYAAEIKSLGDWLYEYEDQLWALDVELKEVQEVIEIKENKPLEASVEP